MDLSALEGRHVLVPVTAQRRHLAERLAEAGAIVEEVEFIAIEPTSEPDALEEATLAWCAGDYDWLAVTSRNALSAMDAIARRHSMSLAAPQPAAQVATVGEATRAVCADLGLEATLVPAARQNARGIVEEFPEGPGKVLAPLGNLAAPVLARGLERKGWTVTTVEAYRTVDGSGVGKQLRDELESGRFDAVLLTSGSVAQRLADSGAQLPPETLVVAIGDMTAATARAAGIELASVATAPSYDGIVAGLLEALNPDRLEEYDGDDAAVEDAAVEDAGVAADGDLDAAAESAVGADAVAEDPSFLAEYPVDEAAETDGEARQHAEVTDAAEYDAEPEPEPADEDSGTDAPEVADDAEDDASEGSDGAVDEADTDATDSDTDADESDTDADESVDAPREPAQSFDDIIAGTPSAASPATVDGNTSFDDIVAGAAENTGDKR
ncbi:uroporphyrinogen-III synthase [Demequina sp. NBRC 110056]|uniref:uroporphyrinogen-III synthase n=1 Tax=Demequina sp. NBRC 110056 TaxID=1570345 RepID=UPI0009FFFE5A|nr:uroporphyrinogen-III synthase [Demequina sp. NBRC 110056]